MRPGTPYPVASIRSRAKGGRAPPTFGGYPAQKAFEPSSVVSSDLDRGIDAEATGGLPGEHVIGDVTFDQTAAVEGTARSVVRSTRWRTVCSSWFQSEAVRWVASWNWTEPSGSSQNTPSMTQTWNWKCAFKGFSGWAKIRA